MRKLLGCWANMLPDCIVGDLDSIRPAVREHYERLGVHVLQDPDQYSTDFTKCLTYLNAHAAEIIASPRKGAKTAKSDTNGAGGSTSTSPSDQSPLEIVILGGLGGRVDQAFSQVHHLYMMTQTQRSIRENETNTSTPDAKPAAGGNLYLVSEESITFIIQTGKNTIHTPATKRADIATTSASDVSKSPRKRKREQEQEQEQEPEYFFEENIGIIPLSAPANITTHGFEWDVENWHTEIGGQISTSNHIRADKVEVETSVPVLFTVELAERLKR
ncbi:Thiamine pyrophosphokinase Thi80, putative [Penicillium digitatum PHI26]|uniref:Thiamine pyrophosphokinase n=2 Tax=Penicillium digitatum TaxID=36651 RepID=K9FY49_PEND2|nr:Thiamine pyrophosphokinase Thi80, putative [Penicillium digitatum Pd1]EKV11897.1 Thiamine pyrophosphokinase Thi80, putative [Penicillium digitatum Pd1]EKV14019.1 Thiamine pyrophosphokinase Thi80, putative [Penicillium digitatum PHI26]